MPETEVKFGRKTVQTRGLVLGHVLESTETLVRSEETLAHTSLVAGRRAREIGKKGSLDDRISGDKRTDQSRKCLRCDTGPQGRRQ